MTIERTFTPIDALAERYLETSAALDPIGATQAGILGYDAQLTDFSPAGHAARADAARQALAELETLEVLDETDRVTRAVMRERLGVELERDAAGEHLRDLNNIESPVQKARDVFDLMATDSFDDWEMISTRLGEIPDALAGYTASLAEGARRGLLPALRQVEIGIAQARDLAQAGSFFDTFTASARPDGQAAPDILAEDLATRAAAARAAYGKLADFLATSLAPLAPAADGVGRDRYQLGSRYFVGATVDLDETYAWGLEELARVVAEQTAIAEQIGGPGTSVAQAVELLEKDPTWRLDGTDALQAWMTETSQTMMNALDGVHFDIPAPIRNLECCIAPTQLGGIYYSSPSEDFVRPGRMWWSVPPGITTFSTWRERTTVYHEGVPGHHLQIATQTYRKDVLNRWRRLGVWISGHGEGWALYAERLADQLGFLSTPADRLGMLDGQRLRAARVVLDIGVHLGLPFPQAWGGGVWDADKAWDFLKGNYNEAEGFVRFELDRYLGWPGQAPSYKIGQRLWEQARDEAARAAAAAGQTFDLKDFHTRALALGAVGLDTLRDALAGTLA